MKWTNKGHEFDQIGEKLATVKSLYFYGIGGHAREIAELMDYGKKWFDLNVFYVDRNEEVRERGFCGKEIMSPETFFEKVRDDNDYLVISCPLGEVGEEIKSYVVGHGISDEDVVLGYDFLFTLIPLYFLYKYDMVFFTSENIVPSSACNLNCRECLNFNPYIDIPVIYSLDEIKRNVDLFFNAVDLIYRFQVTGGEPLLYPHFAEVITYIHENYGDRIFRLETVTNGTVIPDDRICDCIVKNDVNVFLDDYTLSLPYESKETRRRIVEKFEKYNIKYFDNYVDRWFKIYPARCEKKKEELVDFFTKCANPWSTVENGSISACNYELYAQKAGLVEGDSTDFYSLENFQKDKKRELVEFRLRFNTKGYTSFCRKCAGFSVINDDLYYPAIQIERGKR